jgi:hypothetical protein
MGGARRAASVFGLRPPNDLCRVETEVRIVLRSSKTEPTGVRKFLGLRQQGEALIQSGPRSKYLLEDSYLFDRVCLGSCYLPDFCF